MDIGTIVAAVAVLCLEALAPYIPALLEYRFPARADDEADVSGALEGGWPQSNKEGER